jgi:hypothetical protein
MCQDDASMGGTVRFLANSRVVDGVSREELLQYFGDNAISSSTWDLVRHRVVTEHAFKVGDAPGIVVFLDVASKDEAEQIVNTLPVVVNGLLTFDIDPLSPIARF